MEVPPPMVRSKRCAHNDAPPVERSRPGPSRLQPSLNPGHRRPVPASCWQTGFDICSLSARRTDFDNARLHP